MLCELIAHKIAEFTTANLADVETNLKVAPGLGNAN